MKNNHITKVVYSLLLVVSLVCVGGLVYGFNLQKSHDAVAVRSTPHSSNARLVKVIFDKDYIRRTSPVPKKAVKTLGQLMGVKAEKSYLAKDGSIVLLLTQEQRKKMILKTKETIRRVTIEYSDKNRKYKYKVSNDYKSLNAWMDEKASMQSYTAIASEIPPAYSFLYYLEGHKGPWDMTIRIYNCHSGKLKLSFSYWKQPHVTWPLKVLK